MSGKKTPCMLADRDGIARAVEILRGGGLVAIPTETVYGLAARADNEKAVARIFAAKGRPSFNPLIIHVASFSQAEGLVGLGAPVSGSSANVGDFVRECWPGPTTLVLPRRADAPLAAAVSAGLPTVALRMPSHRIARAVIEQVGPLAAPSANRSGWVSPTTAQHVLDTLDGRIDLVLDGGGTEGGLESTILKLREDGRWEELRAGPVNTALWHESHFAGPHTVAGAAIEAPGQLASHYSPGKPVRLEAIRAEPDEFHIGFGVVEGDVTLSKAADLTEAGRRLYACLHLAAAAPKPRVAVAPIPQEGLGIAINDRLRRAAA